VPRTRIAAADRGAAFVPFYLRRLGVLALIGLCAHALVGFAVLFGYAYHGLWLLPLRKWRTRWLLAAALVSAMSLSLYDIGLRAKDRAVFGRAQAVAAGEARQQAYVERFRAVRANLNAAEEQASYLVTVKARLRDMAWHYTQPFFLLPGAILTLFLLGMVAVRHRIFEEPRRWTRVIVGFMVFGIVGWAVARWGLPLWEVTSTGAWRSPLTTRSPPNPAPMTTTCGRAATTGGDRAGRWRRTNPSRARRGSAAGA